MIDTLIATFMKLLSRLLLPLLLLTLTFANIPRHAGAAAGLQSALTGADFKDLLLGELAQDLSDRAFYEVGSASMAASLGEGVPGFGEGGLFKVLFHGLTGGVAAAGR